MKGTLTEKQMRFEVAGFADGAAIPDRYTMSCSGRCGACFTEADYVGTYERPR